MDTFYSNNLVSFASFELKLVVPEVGPLYRKVLRGPKTFYWKNVLKKGVEITNRSCKTCLTVALHMIPYVLEDSWRFSYLPGYEIHSRRCIQSKDQRIAKMPLWKLLVVLLPNFSIIILQ